MADSNETSSVSAAVVGLTDVGRVRDHNEDNLLVMNRADGKRSEKGEKMAVPELSAPLVLAVCDGMGGAAAGEVASQMAVDRMAKDLGEAELAGMSPDQIVSLMDTAVQAANTDILKEAEEHPDRKGMGTTMTACVAVPGQLIISQVGDSRAYVLRKGQLIQVTKDQSLVQSLVEEGTLTEEEAEQLGGKNIVLQAVGVEEKLKVDIKQFDVRRGDLLLLCSDGLSGMVTDAEMQALLVEKGGDLEEAARALIQAGNEGGGKDNITCILARFEGEGLREPLTTVADDTTGGTIFETEKPPEQANPMRLVGAVLGVIIIGILAAFFLLKRDTANVHLVIAPDVDVTVTVAPAEEGGETREVKGKGKITIPDLQPGAYEVTITAAGYVTKPIQVTVTDPGEMQVGEDQTRLLPEKMTGHMVCGTAGTTVTVLNSDDTEQWSQANVPAGEKVEIEVSGMEGESEIAVTFVATCEGFRERRIEQTFEPGATGTVEIPALEEVKATLVIECDEPGVEVEVRDAQGDLLGKWTTDASGRLEIEVRAIPGLVVRARKAGFRGSQSEVPFGDGGGSVKVVMEVAKIQVVFSGRLNTLYTLDREDPAGSGTWTAVFGRPKGLTRKDESDAARGLSQTVDLPPGRYRAKYGMGASQDKVHEFDVKVGSDAQTVNLP